ncbi:histidine triad nucleotide-binding protein [candidate division NPL-UPA2 bacterium]|nr:histidine triad nucleotide-binding protein [candidate division NPL-UPA2 bacterium]
MSDCLFCHLIKGEVKSKTVYEDDEIFAFEDINPQAPIHILIIPKKHIPDLTRLGEEDKELIGKIHLVARRIAEEHSLYESGFRMVANSGLDAGETVKHLHFHLLGGRKLSWPPG